jgi:hypothetical protein
MNIYIYTYNNEEYVCNWKREKIRYLVLTKHGHCQINHHHQIAHLVNDTIVLSTYLSKKKKNSLCTTESLKTRTKRKMVSLKTILSNQWRILSFVSINIVLLFSTQWLTSQLSKYLSRLKILNWYLRILVSSEFWYHHHHLLLWSFIKNLGYK